MQITTTVEITPHRIADLFVTAIEGGDPVTTAKRGGWCEGIYLESPGDVAWDARNGGLWYTNPALYDDPGLRLKVVEVSDETSGATTDHFIGLPEIQDSLNKMAKEMPEAFTALTLEEYDAGDADTFLQYVVFGGVVYG